MRIFSKKKLMLIIIIRHVLILSRLGWFSDRCFKITVAVHTGVCKKFTEHTLERELQRRSSHFERDIQLSDYTTHGYVS